LRLRRPRTPPALARAVHASIELDRGGKFRGVDVAGGVNIRDGVDHGLRHLTAARTVEVGELQSILAHAVECGKVLATAQAMFEGESHQKFPASTSISVGPEQFSAVRSASVSAAAVLTRTPRAPQAVASAAKSGVRATTAVAGMPAASISSRICPRAPLFQTTRGRLCAASTAVMSSLRVNCTPKSPAKAITARAGAASLAPERRQSITQVP